MRQSNLVELASLDRLTAAIGDAEFAERLIATVRAVSEADHVLVFAFPPNLPPRLVVSAGSFDEEKTARAVVSYTGSLYLLDPNYSEIRRCRNDHSAWFDSSKNRPEEHFHDAFYGTCGATDVLAFANSHDEMVFYLIVMRSSGRQFAAGQAWLLMQIGEIIVANVYKHFSYLYALKGKKQFVIDRVLAEAPAFSMLTPRERRVCLGILTGYTSESIGSNLDISANTVLTYRKRLYDKLGISSQNELFMLVIAAMMEFSYDDVDKGHLRAARARPLDVKIASEVDRFNEYYMAEAFILDEDP